MVFLVGKLPLKDLELSSATRESTGNSIVVDVLYHIYLQLYKAIPDIFKDLKVISFFSGMGAFEKALDKLYSRIS